MKVMIGTAGVQGPPNPILPSGTSFLWGSLVMLMLFVLVITLVVWWFGSRHNRLTSLERRVAELEQHEGV